MDVCIEHLTNFIVIEARADLSGMRVPIVKLRPNAILPRRQTPGAAGMDLHACLSSPLTLDPGSVAVIPTGIAIALPRGTEAQIRPRSGLARRFHVTLLNAPGTIDADYRGEVQVILINHGTASFHVRHGDRIAQMVIAHTVPVEWREVSALDETSRGQGGFGHTGI